MSKYEPLATANRRLKEDKNDKEAQKMYDEHFPMYKNYATWCACFQLYHIQVKWGEMLKCCGRFQRISVPIPQTFSKGRQM